MTERKAVATDTIIECRRCNAVRGTLADLHAGDSNSDLAVWVRARGIVLVRARASVRAAAW